MVFEQAGGMRGKNAVAYARGRGDADMAGDAGFRRGYRADGGGVLRHRLDMGKHLRAARGRTAQAVGGVEERIRQRGFETGDAARNRRRVEAQFGRRAGKGPGARQGRGDPEVFPVDAGEILHGSDSCKIAGRYCNITA